MNDSGRRGFAYGLALTALALLGAGLWVKSTATASPAAIESAADEARGRSQRALAAVLTGLTAQAEESAQVSHLITALDTKVNAETFQDLFDNEEWWAGVRRAFPLSAIVVSGAGPGDAGEAAADRDRVLARRGPPAFVPLAAPLIADARARGKVAGLVGDDDRAFLLAATLVAQAKDAARTRPVLLLGQLADDNLLAQVADKTGAALGLSSGRKLLAAAGPAPARQALIDSVGREAAVSQAPGKAIELGLTGPSGALSILAAPVAVTPGLWLWVTGAAPPAPALPGSALALFGLAALGVVGAVVLLVIKRPVPDPQRAAQIERAQQAARSTEVATPILPPMRKPGAPGSTPGINRSGFARETLPMPSTGSPLRPSLDSGAAPSQPSLAVAVEPEPPPTQMGRYRLLKQIGEGGMAEIYIATAQGAEGFERHFVVKRLRPQLAGRKEMVSQFIDEARLQARLLHSNIVSVFDFGTSDNEYFMALEYVHGRDFQQVVDRHVQVNGRPLPVSVVFYVALEVLEALAYAHARTSAVGEPLSIVHRDISPSNVLVSFLGEVKLSDFGIVKAEERVSQTDHGVVKGNVSYMSPEQARSDNVDQRSDLFSLGLSMFYALAGRTLYQGETMMGRLMLAAMGPDATHRQALQELPAEAAAILAKALALDPDARYQSAEEFAKALTGGLAGTRLELNELLKELYSEATRREY